MQRAFWRHGVWVSRLHCVSQMPWAVTGFRISHFGNRKLTSGAVSTEQSGADPLGRWTSRLITKSHVTHFLFITPVPVHYYVMLFPLSKRFIAIYIIVDN